MAEQHRATDSEWYCLEARTCGSKSDGVAYSTILELRDRIEALEAKDEDDKEAWAARLRRPGRSQGERINSLVERIEALEAAQRAINQPSTNRIHLGLGDTSSESNHPAKPDSSLVERVAAAIHPNVCADPNLYLHEARAAIREVAAWLRKHYGGPTATTDLLEREAER
jgi:hypothetical protein